MNFTKILLVGTGGFLGSILRYVTAWLVDRRIISVFPFGTLVVNLAGSFILGVLLAMVLKKGGQENWRLFLGTGFCGGFTTYSAFAAENVNLLQQKLVATSVVYIAISLILGFFAVMAGLFIGRNIP
jgi:CrcB protein